MRGVLQQPWRLVKVLARASLFSTRVGEASECESIRASGHRSFAIDA